MSLPRLLLTMALVLVWSAPCLTLADAAGPGSDFAWVSPAEGAEVNGMGMLIIEMR